jgi:hypothetical protein
MLGIQQRCQLAGVLTALAWWPTCRVGFLVLMEVQVRA